MIIMKNLLKRRLRINNLASKWIYKVDFKSTGGFYYKLGDLINE